MVCLTVRCCIAALGGIAALAAASPLPSLGSDAIPTPCPTPLRISVLDLADTAKNRHRHGVAASQRGMAEALARALRHPVDVEALPLARAAAALQRGETDIALMSESAGRAADPDATRVPLLMLHLAAYRPRARPVLPSAPVGTLRGFVLPLGAVSRHAPIERVGGYNQLMRMAATGRFREVLAYRPSVDVFLAENPSIRAALHPPAHVLSQPLMLHAGSHLPMDCRRRIAAEARQIAEREVARIHARVLPEVPFAPFALPAP